MSGDSGVPNSGDAAAFGQDGAADATAPQNGLTRATDSVKRLLPAGRRGWVALGVVACLAVAGIGWALWPRQEKVIPLRLVTGTVQADLLTPDSVSKLARTTLVSGPRSNQPHAPITVSPSGCAVSVGPSTESVYGHTWSAFVSATYQDTGGTGAYTVNQVIGVFPDRRKAGAAFKTLTAGLTRCPSSTRTDQVGRTSKWDYTADPASQVAVAWTATQRGGGGWACYHQARLKGMSLLQVTVCEAGDGQLVTSKLADALSGKVIG
ncbi:sensor domain-containing protein [Streptomyces canus]|uniref:sensor domain-containing protein n=1 Tax=Streptomyces canus TaxID=58343 RepID=UPI00371C5658